MSLDSWKKEFYPVPADEVKEDNAIEHSLRKWIGLREDNLEKHDLQSGWDRIYEFDESKNNMAIDSSTCSLCQLYLDIDSNNPCEGCPLLKLRGENCCQIMESESYSPYHFFTRKGNPEPMIELLEKARDLKTKGDKK